MQCWAAWGPASIGSAVSQARAPQEIAPGEMPLAAQRAISGAPSAA
jgi:hypothetical protein